MELDLGLALPYHFPIKTAELNGSGGFEPKELMNDSFDDNFSEMKHDMNYISLIKPNISMANCDDSDKVEWKTLPLLIWNGQPNEEDQDGHRERRTFQVFDQESREDNQVVGWPPIKSWRKKLIHGINHDHQGGRNTNERNNVIDRRNSMYVKVKMEGIAIGRKIDLRLYNSYQVLTNSLVQLFSKYQSRDENGERFTLLYQDKEGDWMLAGDVPWQTFLETVRRIQLVRNGKRGGRSTGKSSDIS